MTSQNHCHAIRSPQRGGEGKEMWSLNAKRLSVLEESIGNINISPTNGTQFMLLIFFWDAFSAESLSQCKQEAFHAWVS